MSELSYSEIDKDALGALTPPPLAYYAAMTLLAMLIGWFLICWVYQVKTGLVVTGISHPVGWATYIGSFVFWVGIAHSGTLISAIFHLVRSKWRNAISRASETMTIFAIATAGLFPLIHLGRLWVFYYIIPYPTQRGIYPDYISPLVCDVAAISTYLTVSVIFYYVGLIPDLAAARDRFEPQLGHNHWRVRLYRWLSLGWVGAASQWRHYGRAYLYFAALATPLVISVHSVVSWDFAAAILPGWHSTIFPPYFVAGAIHSGLAMVLTLMIPMRKLLGLERLVRIHHFDSIAQTMLVTTSIVGYAYIVEPFIAWYSGNIFERQYADWRAWGPWAWMYWLLPLLNVIVPLLFVFRKVRTNLMALWIISILINIGMWFERLHIVATGTMHDFLPHNWGPYYPSWVEISIVIGTASFFLFCFAAFAKLFPMVPVTDYKEMTAEEQGKGRKTILPKDPGGRVTYAAQGVLGVYPTAGEMLAALQAARESPFTNIETFSPTKTGEINPVIGMPRGPVRYWTLLGALIGMIGGFWLCIDTNQLNKLIVGGKPVIAIVPFCIIAFEGTVLIGSIFNLAAIIFHARLGRFTTPPCFDPRFTQDRFGVFIACTPSEQHSAQRLLRRTMPEELRVIG